MKEEPNNIIIIYFRGLWDYKFSKDEFHCGFQYKYPLNKY